MWPLKQGLAECRAWRGGMGWVQGLGGSRILHPPQPTASGLDSGHQHPSVGTSPKAPFTGYGREGASTARQVWTWATPCPPAATWSPSPLGAVKPVRHPAPGNSHRGGW